MKTGLDDYLMAHSLEELHKLPMLSVDKLKVDSTTKQNLGLLNGGGIFEAKTIGEVIESLKSDSGLEPRWTWEKYLTPGSLNLLVAPPKAGKTTLAAHLAVAVAKGEKFLGLETTRTNVLWLGLEERRLDVARRFDGLGCMEIFYRPGPFKATESNLADMGSWLKANAVGLVIVDTLSKFIGVADENAAAAVDQAIDPILRIAHDTEAAFVLIHHSRKTPAEDGSDIRGSSVIFGNADVAITLRRDKGTPRRILHSHSRYDETPEKLVIELVEGRFKALGEAGDVHAKENENKLLETLTESPQSVKEISRNAEMTESSARRLLRKMAQAGKVCRVGSGRKGDPETFSRPVPI